MADFSQLTERQKDIYHFIRSKIEGRGYGPTVREIGLQFEIKSPNGVMCHLKALEKKGLIKREEHSARAIQLMDHRPPAQGMPILGPVAAGAPLEAIEQVDEVLELDTVFNGPDRFLLEVHGDSMIEDHIRDGDYAVIKRQPTATNGDTIAAKINNEVTLKRFYQDRGTIRLQPANSTMEPIFVDDSADFQIVGKLVGVLRKC